MHSLLGFIYSVKFYDIMEEGMKVIGIYRIIQFVSYSYNFLFLSIKWILSDTESGDKSGNIQSGDLFL